MEKIYLHKNGMITKKDQPLTAPALKRLGDNIELDKNFTLSSFFVMIKNYPDLSSISDLIDPLLEIVSKAPDAGGYKTDEIESLKFYKTVEIKGFPGPPSLNIYNTLKGMNQDHARELKFFHIETLLGHRLSLGKLKHVVFGDKEDMFQYDTFYTLFELVEGITWELSFNFNPLQCSIRR